MKRISVLEAMLPSAIKAKYKKAFSIIDPKIYLQNQSAIFNNDGYYLYKEAQQKQ